MKLPVELFKIDLPFDNLVKAFSNGNISKVYSQMYETAETLAARETVNYVKEIEGKNIDAEINEYIYKKETMPQGNFNFFTKLHEYKNQRIEYHMDRMQKLLLVRYNNKNNE